MLVAFAGFGGAGKTTAIDYLERQRLGRRVYLGDAVLHEIKRRALVRTPEVERLIRLELRASRGPSALADLQASHIAELIRSGESVLVDAIFKEEEYTALQRCGQDRSVLIAIDASFEIRAERLSDRPDRAYTPAELKQRDETEKGQLGTLSVLAAAQYTISNERSLSEFYAELMSVWARTVC